MDIALAIGRLTFFVVAWIYIFRKYKKQLNQKNM